MNNFEKKRINLADINDVKQKLRNAQVNTICESGKCPNIGECFAKRHASFLIAGNICTRGCSFCAVSAGTPNHVDPAEPHHLADIVTTLNLSYVVITSVTRDDLHDGGAHHFSACVNAIRRATPECKIETLVPDFSGNRASAVISFNARPDIYSHNLETIPRLYPKVRTGADYQRSLDLLEWAAMSGLTTKSGIMLGLGETIDEVRDVMKDLLAVGCRVLTIGQYLAPLHGTYKVVRYVPDAEFTMLAEDARKMGFTSCTSGTYVRSSYMAENAFITNTHVTEGV